MDEPRLIWCADGNLDHSCAAIAAGWLYGVRLPAKGMLASVPLAFADQDWKKPDRARYMAELAKHKPALATVLDWENEEQLSEVLDWAGEAAQHVTEAVLVIPKVPGRTGDVPLSIGGKPIWLAYSVPTSYGGSPLMLSEFAGRDVHLLGGSPQKQRECWTYLRGIARVRSMDGNMVKKQATSRCLYWTAATTSKGHWQALNGYDGNGTTECVRRSCEAISQAWTRWRSQ